MPHDNRSLLFDALKSCELIQTFVDGKKLDDYLGDAMLRSAVERQFIIIGEALGKALQVDPSVELKIGNARRIINFRNVLTHGYSVIEDVTVWGIIEKDVPDLIVNLQGFVD